MPSSATRLWYSRLRAEGVGAAEPGRTGARLAALFSAEPVARPPSPGLRPPSPRGLRGRGFVSSMRKSLLGEGLLSTAVNIFEGRRNLLWVKDLKQLITYCKSNISSMKIIGYIVNANLIVILGDMDKDRATPDRPDNPLSKCRHASNDLHGSGRETRAEQEAQPGYFPGPLLACAVSGSSGHECLG